MSEIILTKDNFASEVLHSDKPVLVDFWATWCGHCRTLSPVIKEIADESRGNFKVGTVNIGEEPELAKEFGIKSIPTVKAFKDGKVVDTAVGIHPKEEILSLLN